jgi:hypothetical protein
MTPEGLKYVSSWVHEYLDTCYQIMETAIVHYWISGSRIGKTSSISKFIP